MPPRPGHRALPIFMAGVSLLAAAGALLPTDTWLGLLRPDLETVAEPLRQGAGTMRLALGLFAATALALAALGHKLPDPRPPREREPRPAWHLWALGLLLVVAALLRLFALESALWFDEAEAWIRFADAPAMEMLTVYETQNQHYLYTFSAQTAMALFGKSFWSFRLPAAIFGVAGVWALYLLGSYVTTRREALLSAALLTVSYHHVWFSQNARGYTAVLFFALAGTYLVFRALDEEDARLWVAYSLVGALGVFAHQTMIFILTGHGLIWLFLCARQLLRRETTLGNTALPAVGFTQTVLLILIMHSLPLYQMVAIANLHEVAIWKNPLWTLRESLAVLSIGLGGSFVVAAAGFGFAAGCWSYLRSRPAVVAMFAIPVALGAALTIALGHNLWPRFFFFGAGFAILIAMRGISQCATLVQNVLRQKPVFAPRLALAVAVLAILISAATVPRAYGPKQDFEGAAAFVRESTGPGDRVATMGMAGRAYSLLYEPSWPVVADVAELRSIEESADATWAVYAVPLHMEGYHPDLLEHIQSRYELAKRFDGTLSGGSIFVYKRRGTDQEER